MEENKKRKKKKAHGNEKPLKINMTFEQAIKKLSGEKPKTKKPPK